MADFRLISVNSGDSSDHLALLFGASITAGLYARKECRILSSAAIEVEGRSIDSLILPTYAGGVNRSLVIQEVQPTSGSSNTSP